MDKSYDAGVPLVNRMNTEDKILIRRNRDEFTISWTNYKKTNEKCRVQLFEGVCIARKGKGISETFTVRKISYQVGVERTFPIHSPIIDHIEVAKIGKVRRAKLHYLRGLSGKAARIKEISNPDYCNCISDHNNLY